MIINEVNHLIPKTKVQVVVNMRLLKREKSPGSDEIPSILFKLGEGSFKKRLPFYSKQGAYSVVTEWATDHTILQERSTVNEASTMESAKFW